jgi:UDP-N-acetylglucosamine acyltransferase
MDCKKSSIHPTAIVEEGAKIGKDVVIEPYAIVKSTVTLDDRVVVKSHAYIDGYTTIGEGSVIWPSACIGMKTQDLKYSGEKTFVVIGKNTEIREFATVHSSTQEGSTVSVGDNCLIMAYCHIAHNCRVGNHVIMSNGAMLAGHVSIEDYAIVGGMTGVHQFVRIGTHSMVGASSRVAHDVPPYSIGSGYPYKLRGLNIVGLKRRGFSYETRKELSKAFKIMYRSNLRLDEALAVMQKELQPLPEVKYWIDFCKASRRGLTGISDYLEEEQMVQETLEE